MRATIVAVGARAADVVLISGAAVVAVTVIGVVARVRALSNRAAQLEEEQNKREHRAARCECGRHSYLREVLGRKRGSLDE